jgi:hypothetical protein
LPVALLLHCLGTSCGLAARLCCRPLTRAMTLHVLRRDEAVVVSARGGWLHVVAPPPLRSPRCQSNEMDGVPTSTLEHAVEALSIHAGVGAGTVGGSGAGMVHGYEVRYSVPPHGDEPVLLCRGLLEGRACQTMLKSYGPCSSMRFLGLSLISSLVGLWTCGTAERPRRMCLSPSRRLVVTWRRAAGTSQGCPPRASQHGVFT